MQNIPIYDGGRSGGMGEGSGNFYIKFEINRVFTQRKCPESSLFNMPVRPHFYRFIFPFLLCFSMACNEAWVLDPDASYELSHTTLGLSFPPVADDEQRAFTAPILHELAVQNIRIGEDWSLREPEKGEYNWPPLDKRMDWISENKLNVFLTIQSTGAGWACQSPMNERSCVYEDLEAFSTYLTQLLTRYPDQIKWIQFGNEWQSDFWYAGSAEQYVEAHNVLSKTVRSIDPDIQVVLGGFTTISLRFMAACGGNEIEFTNDEGDRFDQSNLPDLCTSQEFEEVLNRIIYVLDHAEYDMIDLHLYDDSKQWVIYLNHLKTLSNAPIIVTEFGGPNINLEPKNDEYQAERLEDYIRTLDSLEVQEAFYFKLVEGTNNPAHKTSGLMKGRSLKRKPSFEVFKAFSQ